MATATQAGVDILEQPDFLPPDNKPVTHVVFILDSSGSMDSIKNEAIELFNGQVNAVKANPSPKTTYTFTTFGINTKAVNHFLGVELDKLEKLTSETYTPDAGTPMYDGIGLTVDKVERELIKEDEDYAVLVIIITDGHENSSTDYTQEQISERIKRLEATGRWTFTFLGANIDVHTVAKGMGIQINNVMNFQADVVGTRAAEAVLSKSTMRYMASRGQGITSSADFYGDEGKSDESEPSS